ncbi:SRPBCC family protein [Glutamicibacter protophormiae]|uniref:SRPBCC family protein n=1 Tax=Glutamicibacter protophormiae TaxID=37930 RepID=UPI003A8FC3C7
MAVYFECVSRTSQSVASLWDKSLDIDAHTDSMKDSGERAVAGVTTGTIGLGEQVTWRATHFGVPLRMTSKITVLREHTTFTDEQLHGPFKYFRHVHEFIDCGQETVMIDKISFAAPLGPLGWLAERLVLGWYMPRLIRSRNSFLLSTSG